jgi:L-aspartate oxidase
MTAGAPRWRRDADLVVVGSGAAGISAALTAAAAGLHVVVLTKDLVGGATALAQGGLAAAIGPADSAASHVGDTLVAGAGLCEPEVVAALAAGAPAVIDWLGRLGARLETRELRLEGGHSHRRIVHSGDDATGAEVQRVLLAALLAGGIEILDRTVALDLIAANPAGREAADGGRAVTGLLAGVIGPDGRLVVGVIHAPAVVIAAGGLGQAFATTSNPAGATGDGIAIAARAGAVLRDMEFVQFHPTVLWLPDASGQCPLITEALRGAGAVLRDLDGTPLMAGHDPRGDLAPRDVVAARMAHVIDAGNAGHVWLDATGIGADSLENGFPTVVAACRKHGIDPVTEFIPVAPGAHYSCGGILADLDGRTSIPGLYAVGEAASTGVQGANRLASNSVTEAIIAGRRAGRVVAAGAAGQDVEGNGRARGVWDSAGGPALGFAMSRWAGAMRDPGISGDGGAAGDSDVEGGRRGLALAMSRWAGVVRDREGLTELGRMISATGDAVTGLAVTGRAVTGGAVLATGSGARAGSGEAACVPYEGLDFSLGLAAVEAANLRVVSGVIAAGALRRAESRGCHRRRDAAATAERPRHTLARWDGREFTMAEEEL